jgi:hypothetical protein
VAKYRNNKLPLLLFPTVIYSLSKRYNEAFALIETNNIGQQVVDVLHHDLEYENIYKIEHHHIKGQSISGGFKRATSFGLRTTKSVKKIGCANLKTLIESDKLIINDFDTIAELNTFARVRDSYAAEEGNYDDLVMGLVQFAWLAAQNYFRAQTALGCKWYHRRGPTEASLAEARRWFTLAAEQGYPLAMHNLGVMCFLKVREDEEGDREEMALATHWFNLAASVPFRPSVDAMKVVKERALGKGGRMYEVRVVCKE